MGFLVVIRCHNLGNKAGKHHRQSLVIVHLLSDHTQSCNHLNLPSFLIATIREVEHGPYFLHFICHYRIYIVYAAHKSIMSHIRT